MCTFCTLQVLNTLLLQPDQVLNSCHSSVPLTSSNESAPTEPTLCWWTAQNWSIWHSQAKPEWSHSLDKRLAPENWCSTSFHLCFRSDTSTFFWVHDTYSIISILPLELSVLGQSVMPKSGFPPWLWASACKPVFSFLLLLTETPNVWYFQICISRFPHCNKNLNWHKNPQTTIGWAKTHLFYLIQKVMDSKEVGARERVETDGQTDCIPSQKSRKLRIKKFVIGKLQKRQYLVNKILIQPWII